MTHFPTEADDALRAAVLNMARETFEGMAQIGEEVALQFDIRTASGDGIVLVASGDGTRDANLTAAFAAGAVAHLAHATDVFLMSEAWMTTLTPDGEVLTNRQESLVVYHWRPDGNCAIQAAPINDGRQLGPWAEEWEGSNEGGMNAALLGGFSSEPPFGLKRMLEGLARMSWTVAVATTSLEEEEGE